MSQPLLVSAKFSVERRQASRPDGRAVTHDLVIHPGAVVILPITEDGAWLMIRNWRPSAGRELLELPAGTLEPGEAPERCAHRELEEETGYRAARMTPLVEFYTSPGICTERMYGFVAEGLTRTTQNLDDGEHIRVEIMRPETALRLLKSGAIEDGKTIAMLALFSLKQADSRRG